ncbi:MAG TPA: flagellar biosynthetic protein FliR [Limnochordia bacterium]
MEVLVGWLGHFDAFLPVWARIGGFVLSLPALGRRLPVLVRTALSLLIAFLIFPVVPVAQPPADLLPFVLLIAGELLIGLAIGFVSGLIFTAAYVSGQLIDFPAGFGMAAVFDPQGGPQVPILAQFQYTVAVLIFLLVDAHHLLLRALVQSYQWAPIGAVTFAPLTLRAAVDGVAGAFSLGVQIAFPILAVLFVTDLAIGIIARAVPQANVFFVGFPLKIVLGIALLALLLPGYVGILAAAFGPQGGMLGPLVLFLRSLGR